MPTVNKYNCDINIMIRGIGGQGVKLAGTVQNTALQSPVVKLEVK